MGWARGAGRVFKDSIRNTLPIESWELSQAYFRDVEVSDWLASRNKGTQASESEETPINVGYIWGYYKIGEDIRVSSGCHLDDGK